MRPQFVPHKLIDLGSELRASVKGRDGRLQELYFVRRRRRILGPIPQCLLWAMRSDGSLRPQRDEISVDQTNWYPAATVLDIYKEDEIAQLDGDIQWNEGREILENSVASKIYHWFYGLSDWERWITYGIAIGGMVASLIVLAIRGLNDEPDLSERVTIQAAPAREPSSDPPEDVPLRRVDW